MLLRAAPFLIILTLGFGDLLALPVTSGGFKLSIVILLVAFLLWIAKALIVKDTDLWSMTLTSPLPLLVFAFLGVMFISLINSPSIGFSKSQIQIYIYCIVLFFFMGFTLKTPRCLHMAMVFLFLGGCVVSVFGLVEMVTDASIYSLLGNRSVFFSKVDLVVSEGHPGRLDGLVGDAPFHSIYLVVVILATCYLFGVAQSQFVRWLLTFWIFVFLVNIFGAGSRGGLLALGLAILTFWTFVHLRGKWILLSGLAGIGIFLLLLLVPMAPQMDINRILTTKGWSGKTIDQRRENIPVAIVMFLDHPIIGNGPDSFVMKYHRYAARVGSPVARRELKVHNTPLQILAEYGVVGFCVFMGILILAGKRLLMTAMRAPQGGLRLLTGALFGAYMGYMVFMLTSNSLLDYHLWLILGFSVTRVMEEG